MHDVIEAASIPVMSGQRRYVGVREALVGAHDLVGLAPLTPLGLPALARFLVALVRDAYDVTSARRWSALWQEGRLEPGPLEDYLGEHADRFDLFDHAHPLAQVPDLRYGSGPPRAASALLLGVPSGNNVPIFSAVTATEPVAVPVEHALEVLLTLIGYDTAGIKGGAAGDPQVKAGKTVPPVGNLGALGAVVPLGRTLFETLLLNLPHTPARDGDVPVWRRTLTPEWEIRSPRGPLDLLTWSSRRVRMIPDENGGAVVGAVVAGGDRLELVPPELEPHTRWREPGGGARKGAPAAHVPRRWPSGQQAWRGLRSLLTLQSATTTEHTTNLLLQLSEHLDELPEDYPLSLHCVGVVYGTQSAVIEDVVADSLPLPVASLRTELAVQEHLSGVVDAAEAIRRALNALDADLRRASGGDPIAWDQGKHPGDDAMGALTLPTFRLLAGLQRQPGRSEEGVRAWAQVARSTALAEAERLLDGVGPAAFRGRLIRVGSADRHRRLSDAERFFRVALAKALPMLHTDRTEGATA